MPYSKPNTESEWIKVTEVAATLGCDPRTVIRMIKRGDLKVRAIEFGLAPRVHRGDWQAELDRRIAAGVSA
ncbi:helix-turn-helix domain-containing protein (plasmid) [Streptomyces sp. NEAU-sy36]|uniref:helix-turn-helix domain-containing protein n=1 Tax=unclassified Streptomyces TaxID=2593676 RepID=UPI0015D65204|nr:MULTISPECIES: helix-turn-helix domain-containing protein [unclassified Streptomyces]QLJ06703.1 helix-turn-helix domain-containing protein [Streptomyces sp. NEAU-sy36]